MPNPFVTSLPRSDGRRGWTSTYYIEAADHTTALGMAQQLNTVELGMLDGNVLCNRVAVSQYGINRDILAAKPITRTGGIAPAPGIGPCDGNISLAIGLTATPLQRAKKFLRGLPSALCKIQEPLTFTPDAPWIVAYSAWSALVKQPLAWLVAKNDGPVNTWAVNPITDVSALLSGSIYELSIRRAGRPFGLEPGRRRT